MSRRTQPANLADAGLAWASVTDSQGRQYFTDEFNHRVVVEDLSGRTWTFGTAGRGAGDLRFPRGLAVRAHQSLSGTRVFVADTWNHRVQVFDGTGRPLFAFGGFGTADGQMSAPADLTIATVELPWEGDRRAPEAQVRHPAPAPRTPLLDYPGAGLPERAGDPRVPPRRPGVATEQHPRPARPDVRLDQEACASAPDELREVHPVARRIRRGARPEDTERKAA